MAAVHAPQPVYQDMTCILFSVSGQYVGLRTGPIWVLCFGLGGGGVRM